MYHNGVRFQGRIKLLGRGGSMLCDKGSSASTTITNICTAFQASAWLSTTFRSDLQVPNILSFFRYNKVKNISLYLGAIVYGV